MDKRIERECAEFRLSVVSIDEDLTKLTPSETAVLALVDIDFPSVPNPNEVSLYYIHIMP